MDLLEAILYLTRVDPAVTLFIKDTECVD